MKFEILYPQAYPMAKFTLANREVIHAESSSLVALAGEIHVDTHFRGSQIRPHVHGAPGAETVFIHTFRALEEGAEILLASRIPGELTLETIPPAPAALVISPQAFLAATEKILIDNIIRGSGAYSARQGLHLLHCTGEGKVLLAVSGALHRVTLTGEPPLFLRASHLAGFTEGVRFRFRQVGGIRTTQILGELLDLQGAGTVLVQSRAWRPAGPAPGEPREGHA